jgi:hypothetical protein
MICTCGGQTEDMPTSFWFLHVKTDKTIALWFTYNEIERKEKKRKGRIYTPIV